MPCTVQAVHGLACAPVCAGLGWHALLAQCMVWRVHPCALGWDGMHCLHSAWLGVCTSARWCGWANREKQHGACLVCAVPHLPAKPSAQCACTQASMRQHALGLGMMSVNAAPCFALPCMHGAMSCFGLACARQATHGTPCLRSQSMSPPSTSALLMCMYLWLCTRERWSAI